MPGTGSAAEAESVPVPVPVLPHRAGRFTQCPPPPPDTADPHPGNLAYSLTLPSAVSTPALAFDVTEHLLESHHMGDLVEPALCLVRELVSCACLFTASGEEVYVALRQRHGLLRLTVYDTHPLHPHARLAAVCDQRREAALKGVPELVRTHHGQWGSGAAHHPSTGTRTWATLAPVRSAFDAS